MDDERVVNVQLFGTTSIDATAEGTPTIIEGKVESWTVSFTPENTEFKLQYSYVETIPEPIGKSGRVREVLQYFKEIIWDYKPCLTITVTIDRLPE